MGVCTPPFASIVVARKESERHEKRSARDAEARMACTSAGGIGLAARVHYPSADGPAVCGERPVVCRPTRLPAPPASPATSILVAGVCLCRTRWRRGGAYVASPLRSRGGVPPLFHRDCRPGARGARGPNTSPTQNLESPPTTMALHVLQQLPAIALNDDARVRSDGRANCTRAAANVPANCQLRVERTGWHTDQDGFSRLMSPVSSAPLTRLEIPMDIRDWQPDVAESWAGA